MNGNLISLRHEASLKGILFVVVLAVIAWSLALASCFGSGDRYNSTPLDRSVIGEYPASHRIDGLTRISDSRAYCIPTCLRMIADSTGVKESIEYVNWITGFSYGGFYKDSFVAFMPISDTMAGIQFGSSYLGLERTLFSSPERETAVAGIKSVLAAGTPVMIMYDYNALTGDSFFFPHAAVLVGYTERDFLYFEPGFSDVYSANETGHSTAPIESMLAGMATLQRKFTGSDGYSYMVFRPVERNQNLSAVWKRNGEGLKGMSIPFINLSMGAEACRRLADEIETREIPSWGWESLLPVWLSFGQYSRLNNAEFLASRFESDERILKAQELFKAVSEDYGAILAIIGDSGKGEGRYREELPVILGRIADREEAIGKLFLAIGKNWD